MSEKLTCDVKRNPQTIRQTLPEELFSSFVAYSHILSCQKSVFRNLNPNASKRDLHSGKNYFSRAKLRNFTCKLFSRISVSRLERDLAASVNPSNAMSFPYFIFIFLFYLISF